MKKRVFALCRLRVCTPSAEQTIEKEGTVIETVLTIVLALLVFSLLILIHEAGHYLFARLFGVQINEFSIGMGPKLLSRRSRKTGITYSLRLLPIGGYVAMEGEDGETDSKTPSYVSAVGTPETQETKEEISSAGIDESLKDDGSAEGTADTADTADTAGAENLPKPVGDPFYKKPVWQRMVITAAGGILNLLLGLVLFFFYTLGTPVFGGTQVAEFQEGAVSSDSGLQANDTVLKVGDERVYTANDLVYELFNLSTEEPVSLTVRRDGETLVLEDVQLPTVEAEGQTYYSVDFKVYRLEKNVLSTLKMTVWQTRMSVKMIWDSLTGLVTGRYGLDDLSGPVGVTEALGTAAKDDLSSEGGSSSFLYLCGLITVNLGIFNLLPIPALDGGRLLFQFVELVIRRPIPGKYESLIHFIGILLLLGLMVLVTYKDIVRLLS